jgi:hypothetical protein
MCTCRALFKEEQVPGIGTNLPPTSFNKGKYSFEQSKWRHINVSTNNRVKKVLYGEFYVTSQQMWTILA